jgi:hypothetical protein
VLGHPFLRNGDVTGCRRIDDCQMFCGPGL